MSIDPVKLAHVDELLARLPRPPALAPVQVARIRANVDAAVRPRRGRRFALVGAIALLLLATLAVARYLTSRDERAVMVPDVAPALPPPTTPAIITAQEPTITAPPASVEPPPPPATPPDHVRPRGALRAPAPTPVTPTPAPAESSLGAESRLLGTALRQLRQQADPHAALTTLDGYAAQFPHGVLAAEARAARIEALIGAGDKRGALRLLDAGAVNVEQAVARGELRLEAGRFPEAARDFTSALAGTGDQLEQRALYGRAACRIRLGDEDGARRDLEDYLRRFPHGASAATARTVLQRLR